MEACRNNRPHYAAAVALLVALCARAPGDEPGVIRLPAWVDPSAESTAAEPATFVVAPKPPTPAADEADAALPIRQLEHAASEARTHHQLTRLLARYETVRADTVAAGRPTLVDRADVVGSWAWHARGRLTARQGDLDATLADFRRAVDADQKNAAARHDYALALAETGHDVEALAAFTRVLQIDPSSATARRNRASVRLRLNDPVGAIADCDAVLAATPGGDASRGATLVLRGVALQTAGRLREAAADLTEALRHDPNDPSALTARGHVFAEAGYFDQAISDYSTALRSDPRSVDAYRALAWVLATCPEPSLRDPELAIETAWRARRLQGADDFLTLDASAAAHAAAGEYAEAVRLQQRALMAAGDATSAEATERLALYQRQRPYVAPAARR